MRWGMILLFGVSCIVATASAATVSRTEMLAFANFLNSKCDILNEEQSAVLSVMTVQSEMALAETSAVSMARKAIAAGRSRGAGVACDANAEQAVRAALTAGKSDDVEVKKPVAAEVSAVVTAAAPVAKVAVTKPKLPTKKTAVAGSHGALVEAYYVELRCRKLPVRKVQAMYARVLKAHKAVSANQGSVSARQTLKAAKMRAAARSC